MIKCITELDKSQKGIVIYLFALVICVSPVLTMRDIMYSCPHEAI